MSTEAEMLRADVAKWIDEAKRLSRERDLWCWAFGIALLIGTIAGVVLGFAIAQGVL